MFRLLPQCWPLSFASLSFFFATSSCFFACRILASCRYLKFLLQYNSVLKTLDQPPLLIIFSLKIPPRKEGILQLQIEPCLCQPIGWSMAAMLRDSVVVVVVVRTRPRAIPLAMITMRKSTHGFPFLSHDAYGAPLGGPSGRRSSPINRQPSNDLKCNRQPSKGLRPIETLIKNLEKWRKIRKIFVCCPVYGEKVEPH